MANLPRCECGRYCSPRWRRCHFCGTPAEVATDPTTEQDDDPTGDTSVAP